MRKTVAELRAERNRILSKRAVDKEDELSTGFTAMDSWFPPRPLVKKDKKIIKELYGERND